MSSDKIDDLPNEKALLGSGSEEFEANHGPADENVLSQYTEEEVQQLGRAYARQHELDEDLFAKAALVARSPSEFNSMETLTETEKNALYDEIHNPWKLPKTLYWLVGTASMAACVQGMDETVINGANIYYPARLGIGSKSDHDTWLNGLVNCAPYLCCSCVSVWCTDWLNDKLSRRGVIFLCCIIGALCCIWSALVNNWWHLFIARFFLGFAVGPNSTTVPVYSSECAPARIRGSLVMNWQIWTAFGIMLGDVFGIAFYSVPDHGIHKGLNWRLMLGSACLPSFVILAQIPFCPESPRWLMGKGRHRDAFDSLVKMRNTPLQAARDAFYSHVLLLEEGEMSGSFFTKLKEMVTVRRNRNGAIGAWVCMFMQQFCGINVIAYYSSSIFLDSGFTIKDSLIASWGFGMLNWVFALPAFFSIDKFGRRTLLLFAFPLMCAFLLLTGFAFWIPKTNEHARIGVIALGIYLFTIVYSSSEGPVPFTYSAECASLRVRDVTMSFATATCWFFNFILSLTWPAMLKAFKPQGAFGWYAAWNMMGFFMVLWLLPETKGLTLEELDDVFDVPLLEHAAYQTKALVTNLQRGLLRRDIPPPAPLYKKHRMALHTSWEAQKEEVKHIE
ncbi:hypothetical protein OGAPHI_004731 [Ogataea philodendri]|uniref:Major facilitator superfamily (MFS) profile domain-containing protein n=1 Tax=Ogataea philodendri TaxID=1378263 RepID=A0A9P8P375_9ASCO|nr:uncharacterized protein OGAPHI_004731 [Ogataea philodendri]KAH3664017.1 hypothetical protein OGAPHI_004731 [Ogataea philodendri]